LIKQGVLEVSKIELNPYLPILSNITYKVDYTKGFDTKTLIRFLGKLERKYGITSMKDDSYLALRRYSSRVGNDIELFFFIHKEPLNVMNLEIRVNNKEAAKDLENVMEKMGKRVRPLLVKSRN
jgi:hypothetical protein